MEYLKVRRILKKDEEISEILKLLNVFSGVMINTFIKQKSHLKNFMLQLQRNPP